MAMKVVGKKPKATSKPKAIRTPIAVLISDIHYNLNNLELADAALNQAMRKAEELDVQLIIAGDLHDTKANLRAECVTRLLQTFIQSARKPCILRGNHDSLNEKTKLHALDFLSASAILIDTPRCIGGLYLIPYFHDRNELADYLQTIPQGSMIILHQGIEGSNMGDYVKDASAISKDVVAGFRCISGHYHARQDIQTGPLKSNHVGLYSYIGSPYTQSWGEAKDPTKGFQVLYNDGSLEFIPTNLRKHVICEIEADFMGLRELKQPLDLNPDDLLWVKVTGDREDLQRLSRKEIADGLGLPTGRAFRLDLIANEQKPVQTEHQTPVSEADMMDLLIDQLTSTSADQKARLKSLWRGL